MANETLLWIQIGCLVGGIICALLAYYYQTKFYEGFEDLKKAQKAEGPEKERLVSRAIERTQKQMAARGLTNEGRAKLLNILGLAYRFLAEIKDGPANLGLAIKAYRECAELTDRAKLRSEYVDRRITLGETCEEMAEKGEAEKYNELALAEYKEALAAADSKETAEKRSQLELKIAGCHIWLAGKRKDRYHASEAIRLLKAHLAAIDPQKNPIHFHLGHSMLANAYATAADIDDRLENLHTALEHCGQALAAREQMDRQFSDMTKDTIKVQGDAKISKMIEGIQASRTLSEFRILSLSSVLHMKLADLEDRDRHLDMAMSAADEASKLRMLKEDPGYEKSMQKWRGTVERMRAGESFEQASGKEKYGAEEAALEAATGATA